MKKILLTAALLITCFTSKLYAQPQWKFHIAFEDATGAKDTIWLIYDTTATSNLVDSALGEGPAITDTSVFNVWFYNANFDSTKTWANPYIYQTITTEIRGFNVVYPMIMRWDTSLFNSPILPTPFNFGLLQNYYFATVGYNVLTNDTAYCPSFWWGPQNHFPLGFLIERDHIFTSVTNLEEKLYFVSPTPFNDFINISVKQSIAEIALIDIQGKALLKQVITDKSTQYKLLTPDIPAGIYFIKITNNLNQIHYEKVIKN